MTTSEIIAHLDAMEPGDMEEMLLEIIKRLDYEDYLCEAHEKIGEKYNDWLTGHL